MTKLLRVLVVEDSDDDAQLVVRALQNGGYRPTVERVESPEAMQAALTREWDLIISDYNLPQFSGPQALALARRDRGDVPFIFVSGSIGEDIAVAAMRAGANDYVMKDNLQRLIPAIERELREAEGRAARREAEASVQGSEARLRAILESALDAVVTMNAAGVITSWGPQATQVFGWTEGDTIGRMVSDLLIPPRYRDAHHDGLHKFLVEGHGPILRKRIGITALHRDGHEFPVELSVSPMRLGETWEFCAFIRDMSHQHKTEAALEASEAGYAALVERAPFGVYRSTIGGKFLSVNSALVRMLAYESAAELLAVDMAKDLYVDPADRKRVLDTLAARNLEYDEIETKWKGKDGRLVYVQLSVHPVRARTGNLEYYESFVRDVTEQRRLEGRLVQTTKMEAVGRLAGGVAHDFNNILTAVLAHGEFLAEAMSPTDPRREDVEEIRRSAKRAAALTQQLLAFSRKQVLQPKALDLNDVVQGVEKLLRRLIGEDITLKVRLASDLGTVLADPGQLEQVLVNLAVNARDAMPKGGTLTIETANAAPPPLETAEHSVLGPSDYVVLVVADTGVGMDAEVRAHIFEPFFTTKEVGQGTGMGLATVYGIVKQSGGSVVVDSAPGQGATFRIYLPQASEPPKLEVATDANPGALGGTETVLVVEDQREVREVVCRTLKKVGYRVITAMNAEDARRLIEHHARQVSLVLTDVVMPGGSGPELVASLRTLHPEIRVLYMSGYTDAAIGGQDVREGGLPLIQKPFDRQSLTRRVREALDGPAIV